MTATDHAAKARATRSREARVAQTANARAKRTAGKHDRWIGELREAGWSIVRATEVTIARGDGNFLYAECQKCEVTIGDWYSVSGVRIPLPQVLHAVNSHTCAGVS